MAADEYMSVEEAASHLGVSVATVRRRCKTGAITAHRVGRSWLIDAARLPAPAVRAGGRRSVTASGLVNMKESLRHLRTQDLVRDLWVPDVLRHEDDLSNPSDLYDLSAAKLDRLQAIDPPVTVPVPKSPFFVRNATNLSLADRLAYHAVVLTVAPAVEARTHQNVFSARLSSDRRQFLKPGALAWVQWKAAVRAEIARVNGWMVETDVTAFFDCISHTILMQDLQDLGLPQPLAEAMREMLKVWASAPNTGIPQGPDASRLLANLYMHVIDDVMTTLPDVTYFRYMDDVRIVAPKRHQAIDALRVLDAACRKRNLSLSTKKTSLKLGAEAIESLTDDKIDAAKYAFDNETDPKKRRAAIKGLFKTALKTEEVNGRRARFSLFRLRELREAGSLGLVLGRLADLAPLGWLVPAYLLPWLRRPRVANGIFKYLNDPELNTSDYLSTWLLAALLDEPAALSADLLAYSRGVARDRGASAYHRAVALNVLALGRQPRDIADITDVVRHEFHPEVVRAAVVALCRIGRLDRTTAVAAHRVRGLETTVNYLRGRSDLPSLVLSGRRVPIRRGP